MKKILTLIATTARDTLVDEAGNILKVKEGGPALFLRSVFDAQKIPYDCYLPALMEVEILITPREEKGRIKNPVTLFLMEGHTITTPALVVSTILDEVALGSLANYNGKLFLDVQGYVRDGREFGRKKQWNPSAEVTQSIFCLKATKEELKYVPPHIVRAQQKKMLLVTKGVKGADLTVDGKRYSVVPSTVVKGSHAIGAGDTFFGAFIAEYLVTKDPKKSLIMAQSWVEKFLLGL